MATAQSTVSVWGPKYARPDEPVSLFVQWQQGIAFDAVSITLPDDWRLIGVERVDDARMRSYPLEIREESGTWVAEGIRRTNTPLRLVVTATAGDRDGNQTIGLQPGRLVPSERGFVFQTLGERVLTEVPVEASKGDTGHALDLSRAAVLNTSPTVDLPSLPAAGSFTVEFWFRTVDRNVVLLSSWDGDEASDYPFEFVIDAGGNLRCFSGHDGVHYSVLSDRPVADGAWHHAAYVRDAEAEMASLYVDARIEDTVYLSDDGEAVSHPIVIGGRVGETAGSLTGRFDELRVWTDVRTAETIAAQTRVPGRSIGSRPVVLRDFESDLPETLDESGAIVGSDLALHQPVRGASVDVRSGSVEIAWRITGGEAQTVSLERSEDGTVFVPIYLVRAGQRAVRSPAEERTYAFADFDVTDSSVFYYRFTQDFRDGSRLVSNTLKVGLGAPDVPSSFSLIGNSPNPFVNSTQVFFELTDAMHIRLSVWDISGHLVEWLVDRTVEPGAHQVAFTADNLPSGTYFVRMESEDGVATRKMILRK